MATKFYTCSLAVMYRGKDENGVEQGGPMYFIREGLGEKWKPLAVFFAACGMFGCLPLLQSNQLTQIVNTMFFEPQGWFGGSRRYQTNWCLCRTACSWNGGFIRRHFIGDHFTPCGSNISIS
jgi:hypothetical protein